MVYIDLKCLLTFWKKCYRFFSMSSVHLFGSTAVRGKVSLVPRKDRVAEAQKCLGTPLMAEML